jgi:hypothetical protein
MSRFLVCAIWLAMARAMPLPTVAFSPTIGNFLVGGHGGGPPSSASTHVLSSIHRKPLPLLRRGTSFPLLALDEPVDNVETFATSSEPQCMHVVSGFRDPPNAVNENRQRGSTSEPSGDESLPEYDQIISGGYSFENSFTRKTTSRHDIFNARSQKKMPYSCPFLIKQSLDGFGFQDPCQMVSDIQFYQTSYLKIASRRTWLFFLAGNKLVLW